MRVVFWVMLVTVSAFAGEPPRRGMHVEKWPSGRTRIVANYRDGKLDGGYTEYHENGAVSVRCGYRKGQLHGPCRSYHPNRKPKIQTQYMKGKLHGRYVEVSEEGRLVKDQIYLEGTLAYPRSVAQIRDALARIGAPLANSGGALYDQVPSRAEPLKAGRISQRHLAAALAHLKSYRYLAGVPYEDVTLNERYTSESQHAAVLLSVLGRLDHAPPRPPGVPKEFFKVAHAGASHSNLHQGQGNLLASLDGWMNDSDPSNIDRLGHRRWCINPGMKETGFGAYSGFAAMWALDNARRDVPDFDYIPYPPAGYHPAGYFGAGWAWNVSLNPRKFEAPVRGRYKVAVHPLDPMLRKLAGPLEFDYENLDTQPYGVPLCVIFRPRGVTTSPGSRYCVTIEGLRMKSGAERTIEYIVEFFR